MIIKDFNKKFIELIKSTEEINDLLLLYKENAILISEAKTRDEKLQTKIKIHLKDRKWDRYQDKKLNLSVTISKKKEQKVDMDQLKFMLTDNQLAQVLNTKISEEMIIITPQMRKRLSNYVRKKK